MSYKCPICSGYHSGCDDGSLGILEKENARLKSALKEAVEALEFYAFPLYEISTDNPNMRPIPEDPIGKVAQEALQKLRAPEVKP